MRSREEQLGIAVSHKTGKQLIRTVNTKFELNRCITRDFRKKVYNHLTTKTT